MKKTLPSLVKNKSALIILLGTVALTGCSDVIYGTAQMADGFVTVLLALLKIGIVILVIIFVLALIINIFGKK
jgi:hypothetical protein